MFDDFDLGGDDSASQTTPQDQGDISSQPQLESQQQSQEQSLEGGDNTNVTPEQIEQMIQLKFNHEVKEVPLSEAQILAQKGLNYDKLQERLQQVEQDPRLSFVESLAQEHNMSIEEFIDSFMFERQQAEIEELVQSNIPKEYAEEMVKNREFRQQLENERLAREQQEMQEQDFKDFFAQFRALNGREFDAIKDKDDIPQEVWQLNEQGVPLKFAYMEHFVNQLKNENAVLKQNQINSERSPVGSTTAFGSTNVGSEDEFLLGFNSV